MAYNENKYVINYNIIINAGNRIIIFLFNKLSIIYDKNCMIKFKHNKTTLLK